MLGGGEMRKQDNGLSHGCMRRRGTGFTPRRRVLAGIAALLMCASLIFMPSGSAQEIDLKEAERLARIAALKAVDGKNDLRYNQTVCERITLQRVHCTNHFYSIVRSKSVIPCKQLVTFTLSGPQNRVRLTKVHPVKC